MLVTNAQAAEIVRRQPLAITQQVYSAQQVAGNGRGEAPGCGLDHCSGRMT
jgi:hypothetical protein